MLRKAVPITAQEQGTRHCQTIHSYRSIPISTQTGHGIHERERQRHREREKRKERDREKGKERQTETVKRRETERQRKGDR